MSLQTQPKFGSLSLHSRAIDSAVTPEIAYWLKDQGCDLKVENNRENLHSRIRDIFLKSKSFPNVFTPTKAPNDGKPCLKCNDIFYSLSLSIISRYLRRQFDIRLQNRHEIIFNLNRTLCQDIPVVVLKFDISNFFENTDLTKTLSSIYSSNRIDRVSRSYLDRMHDAILFAYTKSIYHVNASPRQLPRGLSISSTLSEIAISEFDIAFRRRLEPLYYARFVDDCIAILPKNSGGFDYTYYVDITRKILSEFSYEINRKKSLSQPFDKHTCFDFLGYNISAANHSESLSITGVLLDLSSKKVKKIKSRIIMSLKDYAKTKNGPMLQLRLKILTSNCRLIDHSSAVSKPKRFGIFDDNKIAGYYHFHDLTKRNRIDPIVNLPALRDLDNFLLGSLNSRNTPWYFSIHSKPVLLNDLNKLRFTSGFANRYRIRITSKQLNHAIKIWRFQDGQ